MPKISPPSIKPKNILDCSNIKGYVAPCKAISIDEQLKHFKLNMSKENFKILKLIHKSHEIIRIDVNITMNNIFISIKCKDDILELQLREKRCL